VLDEIGERKKFLPAKQVQTRASDLRGMGHRIFGLVMRKSRTIGVKNRDLRKNREFWVDKIGKMIILAEMNTIYQTNDEPCPRLQELPTVTATELKQSTADLLDQVSAGKAVAVTRHDKARVVMISIEQYRQLTAQQTDVLSELRVEYRTMLDEMQSPEQKEAAKMLFEATPEELGAAAVRGAQRRALEKR
jgi:antitoxin Phd